MSNVNIEKRACKKQPMHSYSKDTTKITYINTLKFNFRKGHSVIFFFIAIILFKFREFQTLLYKSILYLKNFSLKRLLYSFKNEKVTFLFFLIL